MVFVCIAVVALITELVSPKGVVTKIKEGHAETIAKMEEAHKTTLAELKAQHVQQLGDLRTQLAEEKAERAQSEKLAKVAVEGFNRLTKRIEGDGETVRRR